VVSNIQLGTAPEDPTEQKGQQVELGNRRARRLAGGVNHVGGRMKPGLRMVALKSPRVLMAAAVLLHFRGGMFSGDVSPYSSVGETCRTVFGLET
jgi:hypothetical protein